MEWIVNVVFGLVMASSFVWIIYCTQHMPLGKTVEIEIETCKIKGNETKIETYKLTGKTYTTQIHKKYIFFCYIVLFELIPSKQWMEAQFI